MKKKENDLQKENEQIDEVVEEVVDEIEEVADEEVVDEVEDVVDEIEEPSFDKGFSPVPEKKTLSKGAKAGIIAGSVVAGVAILVILFIYVLWPILFPPADSNTNYVGIIGKAKPTGAAANAVTSDMTSFEMMNVAIENFYAADYAANICNTGVVSTKVGPINVDQKTHSLKIREGAATYDDVTGTYAGGNAKYFAYSKSFGFANMWEEYRTDDINNGAGSIVYRNAKDMNGDGVVSSWNNDVTYNGIKDFMNAKTTDFTLLWSYDVNENTVTPECKTSKPEYNSKEGYYTFNIKLDITNEEAISGYRKVMEYQMKANLGASKATVTFNTLEFEFSVWDNGFIRYLKITESYKVKAQIGISLSVNIGNVFMNEYCFDENEKIPYNKNGNKDVKVQLSDAFNWFADVK